MDRREFLAKAGLAATWAGVAIKISGCSDDGGGGGMAPQNNDVTGTVSNSSGHSHGGATVTEAALMAGNAVTLTLTGSGHTHTADLSSQDVMDIAAGSQVQVASSSDSGHSHTVTFN